jgi:hypothetical protein
MGSNRFLKSCPSPLLFYFELPSSFHIPDRTSIRYLIQAYYYRIPGTCAPSLETLPQFSLRGKNPLARESN